jgi:hypothetical protein
MARTGREANGWAAGDLLLMFGEFGLVKLDEHITVIYIYIKRVTPKHINSLEKSEDSLFFLFGDDYRSILISRCGDYAIAFTK